MRPVQTGLSGPRRYPGNVGRRGQGRGVAAGARMDHVLDRLPPGSRVAVLRLRSLGDCVLTTPALALLRQARPDLEIAVVVEDAYAAVFNGNPAVDRILKPGVASLVRW